MLFDKSYSQFVFAKFAFFAKLCIFQEMMSTLDRVILIFLQMKSVKSKVRMRLKVFLKFFHHMVGGPWLHARSPSFVQTHESLPRQTADHYHTCTHLISHIVRNMPLISVSSSQLSYLPHSQLQQN